MEDLWEKLNTPMPPEKKISKYRLYKCEWKIGDAYAYPLDAEIWKESGYYGNYLIMQKVREADWWPGHIIPVVRIKITENKQLPKSIRELEALRSIIFLKQEYNNKYMIALGNTSKRIIPKKLIYMGNCDLFKSPSDEKEVDFKNQYIFSKWKNLDERVLDLIRSGFLSKYN